MSSSKDLGAGKQALMPEQQDVEALISAQHRDPFAV